MSKVLTGQVTTTQANLAVALGEGSINDFVMVKAHPDNTEVIFVGNNGSDTVTSGTGYPLSASEALLFNVGDIGDIYIVSESSGQVACWARGQV